MVGESDRLASALASPLTLAAAAEIIADPAVRPIKRAAYVLIFLGIRLEVVRLGSGDSV
jgi:hypothetical protein